MKTIKNKIVASALALSLVGGAVIANPKKAEAASKPLMIKKVLNLSTDGVTTPAETFTFSFTKSSKNGDENKKNELPNIDDVKIEYKATDTDDNDTTKDGKQLIKESSDILANVQWQEAGQYTYTVEETAGSTENMVYSKASYLVSVFVKKTDQGGFEVENIFIKKLTNDKGEAVEEEKSEYQPGDDEDTTKDKNKFDFENDYNKKDGNDNPGGGDTDITNTDKKGFALRKIITDQNPDANAEFTFKFKLDKPKGTKAEDTSFDYYVVDNQGNAGAKKTANYGEDVEGVILKHNERIVFGQVLLGSTVTFDETNAGAYTGTVSSTFDGTAGADKSGVIGDQQAGNFAEYKNTKQTPTGLLVENLPFIALILVAGGGIFFFVKNKKEEALA